jgi:hypothetical protein
MEREEALHEFIKGLRIALNNSTAYPSTHPYFIKSAEEFKARIEAILVFINPVRINVTPESLFLDGRYWAKPSAYVELAQMLHQRKISGISFQSGLDIRELTGFLSILALAPKDIVNAGGIEALLKKGSIAHILVEELDYSNLLKGQAKGEGGDIWQYIFKGAVERKDASKINEIADDFRAQLKNFSLKDLLQDEKLRESLAGFLSYLKQHNREKFLKCSQELFDYLASSKGGVPQSDLDSLKTIFKDFSDDDFAQLLWLQASKDAPSDPLSVDLLSVLSGKGREDGICESLLKSSDAQRSLKENPLLAKRVSDLINNPDSQSISSVYRNTLSILIQQVGGTRDIYFDPQDLHANYTYALLNLLAQEDQAGEAAVFLAKIEEELPSVIKGGDYAYLKELLGLIDHKKFEDSLMQDKLKVFRLKIFSLIEECIWDEPLSPGLEYLASLVDKSCRNSQFYFNMMFAEGKISAASLRIFLASFPSELESFYKALEAKATDLEYLSRLISVLVKLKTNLSSVMLKRIYYSVNDIIKALILESMDCALEADRSFAVSALKEGNNRILKKAALKSLSAHKDTLCSAMNMLIGIPSPFGSRNNILLENLAVIGELNLKECGQYIIPFTKLKLPWHAPLKERAAGLLELWQ